MATESKIKTLFSDYWRIREKAKATPEGTVLRKELERTCLGVVDEIINYYENLAKA